ncbi:oxidoreductase [Taibaiella koreensis]|uniref:oxidoreductase n=1 Tax=Taibaiella koreensis TaxID=1268548 RepID=UPI000E59CD1A|nr:oxidoreductase [Taibaiella koreensis]
MEKVWLITGSARGLGRSLTEAVLAHGESVVATARQPEQLADLVEQYAGRVLPLALDVSDPARVEQVVAEAIRQFGRIDVLVNNAGFGITGAAEGFTEEQVRSQLEVNLCAPIAITRAVLPHMRRQRSGRILQISSVGGRVGNAGLTMYQAAKFGLTGFSEALHKEVAHLGIHVTSVEPGGFRTDWAGASMTFAPDVEGYEQIIGGMKEFLTSGKFIPVGDPVKAAKALIDLAAHPEPPVHLILGSEAIGIVKKADEIRREELEKWLPVSVSTDHEDAFKFFESEEGRAYLEKRGIKL